MAGFKNRYLIVKIDSFKKRNLSKASIYNILYNNIKYNFGEYTLSLIDTFEVIESYENLEIVIIKCNLQIYKYLCYCLVTFGSIKDQSMQNLNDDKIKFSILLTSGILKKAKRKFLKMNEFNKI